jgi:hypothetical protein
VGALSSEEEADHSSMHYRILLPLLFRIGFYLLLLFPCSESDLTCNPLTLLYYHLLSAMLFHPMQQIVITWRFPDNLRFIAPRLVKGSPHHCGSQRYEVCGFHVKFFPRLTVMSICVHQKRKGGGKKSSLVLRHDNDKVTSKPPT